MAWKLVVLSVAFAAVGCGGGGGRALTELERVRAGNLDVVLLSADGALSHGKDALTLEFRAAGDGALVDVGTVTISATMPMAGMAPMMGGLRVRPGDTAGRYAVESDLSMAGTWRLGIAWEGPDTKGTAAVVATVQ